MLGVPCRRLITYQVPGTGYNTSEWTNNKEFTAADTRPGVFTVHDSSHASDQEECKISRGESGQVRRCSTPHG